MAHETETRRARATRVAARREQPRLDQPRAAYRQLTLRPRIDSERFGQASENLARYFGTARYLVIQTAFVLVWIFLNVIQLTRHWDPYPFILLNLAFSTQAAYAAPLILLAQNRQADRDRVQIEQDRERDEISIANTEYLLREVATLRLAVNEVATRDYVRSELQAILKEMNDSRTVAQEPAPPSNAG
ncbi:DUF1003 domain-containing protein [Actinocrinis puniceicyclus]|uniref:DUF1003 domain-containing protein n=1 Tax=Actinocrinis puniceicyclus TaxID=977794 RepID=A0A8J7WLU9_9ACTN|nr:DUF1003 domain-containing protein [Actinocrinis puniceicyclus]MBS2963648.1 DUF1003 domain-containing protein [Actinocrinis puniceicyclus]